MLYRDYQGRIEETHVTDDRVIDSLKRQMNLMLNDARKYLKQRDFKNSEDIVNRVRGLYNWTGPDKNIEKNINNISLKLGNKSKLIDSLFKFFFY